MSEGRRKKSLSGSTFAKIVAYVLLTISAFVGIAGCVLSVYMLSQGMYTENMEKVVYNAFRNNAYSDSEWMGNIYIYEKNEKAVLSYCEDSNVEILIEDEEKGEVLFSSMDKAEKQDTPFVYEYYREYYVHEEENTQLWEETEHSESVKDTICKQLLVTLYVDKALSKEDAYSRTMEQIRLLYEYRYIAPNVTAGCIFICLICISFLLCGAGHKNGKEGITPGVMTRIYFDLFTVFWGMLLLAGIAIMCECIDYMSTVIDLVLAATAGTAVIVLATVYLQELALRIKKGGLWKHTLIYVVLRIGYGILKKLGAFFATLLKGLPLVMTTVIGFLGISIIEFFGILIFANEEVFVLWLIEKCILFVLVMYVAIMCKQLQKGSEALAEGNLNHHIDTDKMVFALKEHGENLNCIGMGMTKAVEERMKSERLKTELITNVSHDLKTPLTSIINYADLLGSDKLTQEQVSEYAEVLLRQSNRLKKLLDDLMDASKATTGNLEVHLEKCEVGVLLTQAAGEYEQRFREKQLQLITSQPKEAIYIQADGKHLWRVFDNLLNNICKYAQENSRVYLNLEKEEDQVFIIFRNMSKYALNIPAQELEERFVRGDKSRHMEGNGLGLSIAKSLVDLQNGSMQIMTDGDLFKVILMFHIDEVKNS